MEASVWKFDLGTLRYESAQKFNIPPSREPEPTISKEWRGFPCKMAKHAPG
jgi:hypothetical protein